jgi:hypothetical protein
MYLTANSRYITEEMKLCSAASCDGGLGMSGILSQGLLTSPHADRPSDTTPPAQTHSLGCLVGGPLWDMTIPQLLSTKLHHFLYNTLAEEQFSILHRDNFTFLFLAQTLKNTSLSNSKSHRTNRFLDFFWTPGVTWFSDKQWVWNGVHSASWV